MAQGGDEWKTGQDIEIYDTSQEKWIIGTIYDIRQEEEQNIYCVQYDEYSQEIPQKDANALLRTPKTDDKSNENDARETLLNISDQIATELPISRQIDILSEKARGIAAQRMIYLYMMMAQSLSLIMIPCTFSSQCFIRAADLARSQTGNQSGAISHDGYGIWNEC